MQTKLFVKSAAKGTRCQILLSDSGSVQDVPAILKKMGHRVEIKTDNDSNRVILNVEITK